jgi:hypothetical protein
VKLHEWVEHVGEPARQICDELGVPWQVCWAQARLESGKGTNVLAKSYNFWGVKPRKCTGHMHTVIKLTTEYGRDGKRRRVEQEFAGWDSVEQGVRGYCAFVTRKRYAGAAVLVDDPLRWIAYVVGKGYATLAPGKYTRRFRKRLEKLHRKMPSKVAPTYEIDEGLAASLAAMDKERPGRARWAVADFELQTELRRLPFEELDFEEQEVVV